MLRVPNFLYYLAVTVGEIHCVGHSPADGIGLVKRTKNSHNNDPASPTKVNPSNIESLEPFRIRMSH